MTQFCCYRVWDGSHEKHRRVVLLMTIVDLFLITFVITYVAISLYNAAILDPSLGPDDPVHHKIDLQEKLAEETEELVHGNQYKDEDDESTDAIDTRQLSCLNETEASASENCIDVPHTAKFFPVTPYFQVVGYRVTKSIQLIIYTCELFMTVFLVRALLRTDTQLMRTWLIVTEIITTVVFLILILHLFSDFNAETVILTITYLIYQFAMIRTLNRFIRRTEIELTQFGSIVEI